MVTFGIYKIILRRNLWKWIGKPGVDFEMQAKQGYMYMVLGEGVKYLI